MKTENGKRRCFGLRPQHDSKPYKSNVAQHDGQCHSDPECHSERSEESMIITRICSRLTAFTNGEWKNENGKRKIEKI